MKNAYLVRGKPSGVDHVQTFLQDEIVAVGWSELSLDLSGMSKEKLKSLLEERGQDHGTKLGSAVATLDLFVNRLHPGDLILMPDSNDIHLGRLQSDYFYNPRDLNSGYPHQHQVDWVQTVTRSDLTMELRSALKAWRTVSNLSRFYDEIEALAAGPSHQPAPEETVASGIRPFAFPLRDDFIVRYELPTDMTKSEARELKAFFSAQGTFLDVLYGIGVDDSQ